MGIFMKLKQRFCKHHFVKHYSSEEQAYVYRCTKCNKVITWKEYIEFKRSRTE